MLKNLLAEGEDLVLGRNYNEEIAVQNSGAIDAYVRLILTKSWKDAQGVKNTALSPQLIHLDLVTNDNGWVIDQAASTEERTVLYYSKVLPVGETTPAVTDILKIDPAVATKVIETVETEVTADGKELKTITYVYEYDGYTFSLDVEVDAVQTHNAQAAIKSAWGVNVNVSEDGSLRLQ